MSIQGKKEKIKYYFQKENKVYILIVSYGEASPIQFGVTEMDTEYIREKKITADILGRYYEDGRASYVTYKKGEILCSYEKPFAANEKIIMLYRPSKKDKQSRDSTIFRLLYELETFIKGRNKLIAHNETVWRADKEVINEHIRKNNLILFEIEKMIQKYCWVEN